MSIECDTKMMYIRRMEYTRITLRIPVDLHEAITETAEKASRSINAEIIALLRTAQSLQNLQPLEALEEKPITREEVRQIVREELRATKCRE